MEITQEFKEGGLALSTRWFQDIDRQLDRLY